MYEEKLKLISKDTLIEKPNEKQIFDDIDKETLYDYFLEYKLDKSIFDKIFYAETYSTTEQNEINQIFRTISKTYDISMVDIVLFLENDFGKLKKILSFLDGDSKSLLKKHISNEYHIKMDSNKLYKILR
ncbi:MAG: hypothetical protein WC260_01715 [Candidatus Pacearchaeota archaeon]